VNRFDSDAQKESSVSNESIQPNRFVDQTFPKLRFDPPHPKQKIPQLAVNQVTTYRWSLEQDLENYRRAGVSGIGIWRKKVDECGEDDAIESLIDSGLPVTSVSFAGGFTGSLGYRFEEAIADSVDAIRLASKVNAQCVFVATGSKWRHIKSNALRLLDDGLKRLGDLAADRGVKVALHPMCSSEPDRFSLLVNMDETLDAIDRCNHEAVGLAFSSFHHFREPDVLSRLSEISHLVTSVQLSDDRQSNQPFGRSPIGDGEIPLGAMVRILIDNGYNGPFELDLWSRHVWNSDYSVLLAQQVRAFNKLLVNEPAAI
jgi:sugar phosphate isomerase/epimerase